MRWDSNKPWRAWDRERHPGVGLLRNLIGSDVSRPCFVDTTTLVFQLLLNFSTVLDNQTGNLCRIIISSNQPWSTKSYIILTSIHAKLRLLFRRWQSKVTVLSISKLSIVLLHPPRAPLWAPSIKPWVLTGTTYTKYLNRWSDSRYRWWILRVSGVVWFCLRRTRLNTLCWYSRWFETT